MSMNLRQRLLAPILLLLLLGIGAVSWIAVRNTADIVRGLDEGTSSNLLDASRDAIESWKADRLSDMGSWLHFALLRETALDPENTELVEQTNELLVQIKSESRHFSGLRLAGIDGMVIASSSVANVGNLSVADRDYFQSALGGERFFSKVLISKTTGKPILVAASPVQHEGEILAVLYGVLNLDVVSATVIEGTHLGESNFGMLINSAGMVLAHPDASLLFKPILEGNPALQQMLQRKQGSVGIEIQEVQYQARFLAMSDLDCLLLQVSNENSLMQPVQHLKWVSAIVGLIASLCMILLVSWVIRALLFKPLRIMEEVLSERTEDVQAGYLRREADLSRVIPELRPVLQSANELATQLVGTLDNLPLIAMTVGKDFEVRYINRVGAKMLGTEHEAVEGKKCHDQLKLGICGTKDCVCTRATEDDKPCTRKTTVETPMGRRFLSAKGIPLKNAAGDIIGAWDIALDETEAARGQLVVEQQTAYQQREVETLSQVLHQIADGNMRVQYENAATDENTTSVGEAFSALGVAVNRSVASLTDVLQLIKGNSGTLASSAEELTATSTTMDHNLDWLSKAVNDLTKALEGIAERAQEGREISQEAIDLSNTASDTMQQLGSAATEIDQVTDMIKRIAHQTNMLALNATIEAASAGSAGKGFAVVAGEIKELAHQSANAAEDIASRIEDVQKNSNAAVDAIASMAQIVYSVTQAVEAIAQAVQEQTVGQQGEQANVDRVHQMVGEAVSGSQQVNDAALDLARIAGELDSTTGRFQF